MEDAVRYLLSGISYGMLLFLIASGLSLILGVMGILNFAHGSLYMLGAYMGLTVASKLGNFWIIAVVSGLAVGLIGLIVERVFLRRLYKQFNEQVLLTLGFVFILANLALWVWGAFPYFGQPPPFLDFSVPIGRLTFPVYRFALLFIGLLIAAGLWWFQEKTRAGAIVRAGMDDKDMTMGLGINYGLVCSAIFFLGTFVAGFTGFIGSPLIGAQWDMGFRILPLAIIVVIIGGVGRVEGTLLAALLVGLIDSLGKAFFPDFAMFTIYLVFVAFLLVKPSGLLGRVQVGGMPVPSSAVGVQKKGVPRAFWQTWQAKLATYLPYIIVGAILLIWAPFIGTYVRTWMTQILIFSIFAVSLNFLFGYAGLFSLGHAAFFGLGAYTAGILAVRYGIESFWLLAPAGILLATAAAAIFGIIALRVSGVYFLFVTLAIGELLVSVAIKWVSVTGGTEGIFGIPYPNIGLPFTMNETSFYYLVLIIFGICMYSLYRIIKSPFGLALQGIRDDERRAQHLGYNAWLNKYIAFIIGGLFAGVAGVLYAPFARTVVPSSLGAMTSAMALLMIILGGSRTFFGPIVGAAVILFLQYFAGILTPERWPLILGGVFVLTVMFLPGGISTHLVRLWNKVRYSYGSTKA